MNIDLLHFFAVVAATSLIVILCAAYSAYTYRLEERRRILGDRRGYWAFLVDFLR